MIVNGIKDVNKPVVVDVKDGYMNLSHIIIKYKGLNPNPKQYRMWMDWYGDVLVGHPNIHLWICPDEMKVLVLSNNEYIKVNKILSEGK